MRSELRVTMGGDREVGGVAPSDAEVHVPLCIVYDVAGGRITEARIYFEAERLRAGG